MKTLYLECYSGISGDMTVAALLDLGASEEALRAGLSSLDVSGYDIKISRTAKCGISACDFNVILHKHEHEHGHHHEHRGIAEINAIIDGSEITDNAKALAKKIFYIVAEAEAKVHGLPVGEVHFHEVGAVDSIVDIVGAAICADNLGIGRVLCTPLREGQGTVWCGHGRVPVPAPATLEIAKTHAIPLVLTDNQGEMVTPTGAAIVAALCGGDSFSAPQGLTVLKTGYGAGKKDFKTANLLRASLVELSGHGGPGETDEVLELECNIDDMTGEQLAHAMLLLLETGALDCWLTPVIMKKSRPAQHLSLLIEPAREEEFTRLLFRHTSTAGIRVTPHRRTKMRRRSKRVETVYGELYVKEFFYDDICKTSVEYESAKKLSIAKDIPISEIYRERENSHI